jgi:hypothetical protein
MQKSNSWGNINGIECIEMSLVLRYLPRIIYFRFVGDPLAELGTSDIKWHILVHVELCIQLTLHIIVSITPNAYIISLYEIR